MAQTIKYIGRTTDFRGKTLWEIVGNLKDYGVGRIIIRNMFQRYEEPCYMKIVKVDAQPQPSEPLKDRHVDIWVEKVFRGVKYPNPVNMLNVSYKTDYRLIPKDQETQLTSRPLKNLNEVKDQKLMPQSMDLPPLLHRLVSKETGNPRPQITVIINKTDENFYRFAEADETPTVQFPRNMGLGKPTSPNLYKGLNLTGDEQK